MQGKKFIGINFDKIHFFDKETELSVPTMEEDNYK